VPSATRAAPPPRGAPAASATHPCHAVPTGPFASWLQQGSALAAAPAIPALAPALPGCPDGPFGLRLVVAEPCLSSCVSCSCCSFLPAIPSRIHGPPPKSLQLHGVPVSPAAAPTTRGGSRGAAACTSQPCPGWGAVSGAHVWSLTPPCPQEAEKNAKELVAEEERIKKKAEKKKLKKKKQKDRKKQEKLKQERKSKQEAESNASSLNGAAPGKAGGAEEEKGCSAPSPSQSLGDDAEEGAGDQGGSVEVAEDELDLSCTFVFKARQKAGVKLQVPEKEKPTQPSAVEPNKGPQETAPEPPLPCLAAPQAPEPVPLDTSVVEQSLMLAGHGNEAAQKGYYEEAVRAFTEAVRLNPREHRLFGNRSYCYEKLQQYEEALRDAQMSLSLQPNWPKGFFRKGKALRGLKRYAEAVRTFEELLRLDGAHPDAAAQLQACRVLLQQSSAHTADGPGGVPVLSLLEDGEPPLPEEWVNGSCSDTDMSGFVTVVKSRSHSKSQARATAAASTKQQQQLPPHHPARFGKIQSIRMLPGKRCAFINFKQKAAAEAAYEDMLDADLEGSRLVLQLKHPSHATPSPWQRP
uniref:Tetratricopeptide repeat protein 31 n=1 Tax=Anas zonorhyncha TaxID=75864 RepID=A0A8B9ZPS3_9AVES